LIQLSPINTQYINNQKGNIATKQTSLIEKDENDVFIKNHKKAIVFGSMLGGVALATGACILAFNGKLGSKAQGLINGIVNKFSSNVGAVTAKQTNILPVITKPAIKPIESDGEYIEIMNHLMDDPRYLVQWKVEGANIFDLGTKPWGDTSDIHSAINDYISKGSIPETYILPDKQNDSFMDDIVRCFQYALKKEDEKFGQFKGVVFRHGFFGDKNLPETLTDKYYATSTSPKILFTNEHQDCHVILTNNGHKLYKTQEQLGDMWHANSEREVVLNPNERYRRIEKPSQELISMARQTLDIPANYENSISGKLLPGGISEQDFWKDYLEDLLDKNKLIFWEKVD